MFLLIFCRALTVRSPKPEQEMKSSQLPARFLFLLLLFLTNQKLSAESEGGKQLHDEAEEPSRDLTSGNAIPASPEVVFDWMKRVTNHEAAPGRRSVKNADERTVIGHNPPGPDIGQFLRVVSGVVNPSGTNQNLPGSASDDGGQHEAEAKTRQRLDTTPTSNEDSFPEVRDIEPSATLVEQDATGRSNSDVTHRSDVITGTWALETGNARAFTPDVDVELSSADGKEHQNLRCVDSLYFTVRLGFSVCFSVNQSNVLVPSWAQQRGTKSQLSFGRCSSWQCRQKTREMSKAEQALLCFVGGVAINHHNKEDVKSLISAALLTESRVV